MISVIDHLELQAMTSSTMLSVSILICTYNPDETVFRRTLKSVESLIIPEGIPVECLIVDNNSPTPVEQISYVQEFLEHCSWAKVIRETRQGLTFARIAGFQAAANGLIIFIDDDNEVSSSYLDSVANLFAKYPSVSAWGPGNVDVEYMENVSTWFEDHFNCVFQEKHIKHDQYGCVPETWTAFYPIGTGLVVRRKILEKYCAEVQTGNLSSLDRTGKSLSSGGDIQIVWEAIKMGDAVGISPSLAVRHLIPSSRSNLDYVKRLSFGTASSYLPCLVSSFPEVKSTIAPTIPNSASIIKGLSKKIIKYSIKLRFKLLVIDLANHLGILSGQYQAIQQNNPIVNFMIKQLKLR
jgi:glycosyltransferase involved in cell wall biosynthesis